MYQIQPQINQIKEKTNWEKNIWWVKRVYKYIVRKLRFFVLRNKKNVSFVGPLTKYRQCVWKPICSNSATKQKWKQIIYLWLKRDPHPHSTRLPGTAESINEMSSKFIRIFGEQKMPVFVWIPKLNQIFYSLRSHRVRQTLNQIWKAKNRIVGLARKWIEVSLDKKYSEK